MENILNFVIVQFIAHLITDFYSQNDEICNQKEERGFRTRHLYGHALLIFLMAWLFSFSLNFGIYALAIGVVHLLIDGFKSFLKNWKYVFFADQMAHIAVIYLQSKCRHIPARMVDLHAILTDHCRHYLLSETNECTYIKYLTYI